MWLALMYYMYYCTPLSDARSCNTASLRAATAPRAALCNVPSPVARVVTHGIAHGALARPECRHTGAQLGDALDACCAQAEEVESGELGIDGFGEVGRGR